MAARELNISRNSYRAQLDNAEEREYIGEKIHKDPWYREQPEETQRYLDSVFITGEDGSKVNLGVAILNRQGISRVLENSNIIINKETISPYEVHRGPDYYEKNRNIEKGYRKLNESGFFSSLLDKTKHSDTAISLAYENNAGYQIHQTTKQMMDGLNNILRQNGMAVGWDLETTGGINVGERNVGQHITEFSFVKQDVLLGTQPDKIYSSVIGATEEEYKEYLDLIEKYEKGASDSDIRRYGGTPISAEERVTATRLAKMGVVFSEDRYARGGTIDWGDNGVINFKKFVGSKEIALMDPSMMRKGAEFLREVGKRQREAEKIIFTLGNDNYNVAGWEAELLKGLHTIQHGGIDGKALTAVGHNTMTFDISVLNRLFNSDKISEEAKKAYSALMKDKGLSFDYNLDTLPLTRRFLPENFYTDDDLKQMERLGLTENQQESVVRRLTAYVDPKTGIRDWSRTIYDDPRNAGAAHMAVTDVLRNLEMLNSLVFKDNNIIGDTLSNISYNENEEPVKLEGNRNRLFFAKSHLNEKTYNLLQFMRDELSGEIRTADSIAMSSLEVTEDDGTKTVKTRTREQLFGQFGMQKGVTYKVNRLFDVKTDKTYHKIMREMYPNLDIDRLTVLELQAYAPDLGDKKIPVRAQSPIYYVGYKQDIANAMMDNTFYIGDLKGDGTIDTDNVSDFTKQQLTKVSRDSEGVVTETAFNANDVIADGAKRAEQEAAARFIRQHDYKRDQKLLVFIDHEAESVKELSEAAKEFSEAVKAGTDEAKAKGKLVAFLGTENEDKLRDLTNTMINGSDEEKLKVFHQRLWENSVRISTDLALGNPVQKDELAYSYNEILGFKDLQTNIEGNLYSETLTAQIGRLDWARKNMPLLKAAAEKAEDLAKRSDNKDVINYYYGKLLQGVEDYIEAEVGKNSSRLGWQLDGVYSYEFDRTFDIDLSGYHGLPKNTKVSLNLESRPETMVNAIIRAAKGELFSERDYTAAERGAILRDVQRHLYQTRQIGHFTDGIRHDNKEQFIDNVLTGKTNYSQQFIEEFRSQLDKTHEQWQTNPNRIKEGDSAAVASYKLLRSLQNKRETGRFTGHLSETYRHFADAKMWQETLPKSKIDEVLDNIGKTVSKLSGIFSVDPLQNKRTVVSDEIINNVVENILLDKRITENVLQDAGYTEKDRKALLQIRELHKQGLQKYTRALFEMVGNMGGQVEWSEDTRQVFATKLDGKTVDLGIPTELLIDGQVQYRVGPSILSMPVGVYDLKDGFRGQHELKMTSLLEKAVVSQQRLIDWHERQALLGNGSKLFRLQKAMSAIGKIVREAPAATEIGLKSRGNQFKVQYKDIAKNIPALLGDNPDSIDQWQTDDAYKKIIKDLATGKATYNADHPAYEHYLAIQANIDRLLTEAYKKNIIEAKSWDDIMTNFTADVKGAAKLEGQAASQGDFYARYNGMKRDASGIEDATKLNVTTIANYRDQFVGKDINNIDKAVVEEFEGLRDVGFGKGITDAASYAHSTVESKNDRQLNTHVQLNAFHASPMSINALVMSNMGDAAAKLLKEGDKISEGSMNLLATMSPIEGTGFMHGHIFDRIFSERDTIQKLGLRKVIDNDGKTILELQKKAAAMPFFDISSKEFHYGEGSFVSSSDIIGHVEGFGMNLHGERAKYEGLLKLGAFDLSSGHLVEEAEISRIITESIKIDDIKQLSAEERAKRIVDLLEQKYNLAYYIQTEKANPLVKITEMAEKGMVRGLILGTGEADDRIAQVMEQLGFHGGNYVAQEAVFDDVTGALVQKQITKTLGRVDALDIKMIDDLKKGNLGAFGVAAKGRYKLLHGEDLSDQKIQDTIKGAGFADVNSFRQAIIHERYQPSRLMAAILENAGMKGTNEVFHMITNHLDNMKKHGDISAYRYLVDEWIFRENKDLLGSKQTAAELVKKYLLDTKAGEYKGTVTRQGDSIVLSETPRELEANIKKIRQAYLDTGIVELTQQGQKLSAQDQKIAIQKYTETGEMSNGVIGFSTQTSRNFILGQGVFEKLTNEQGQFVGQYEAVRSDFARVGHYWDWAKETYDAVKFNQRAITALSNIRADEHGKENVRRFLDERAKAYGGKGSDIYETFIKDLKKGEIVPSAAIDQIYRNMFNRQGGGEKLSGFIKTDTNGNLTWGINEDEVRKFVRNLDIGHGDEQKGVNIMTSLLGRVRQGMGGHSITTVNEKGAFNLWRAFSATAANSINTGVISTPAEAERLGFKTVKLENLLTGKLGASDFDESLYGHNWLIDLGEHSTMGDKLYLNAPNNKSGRYLAIAADHIEDPGAFREAISDKPQEKVKLLQEAIEDFQYKASHEGFQGEEKRQEALQKIYQRVQDIKDAQRNVWESKGGIMAQATQAWMHDASRNTARGANLLGTENIKKSLEKAVQVDTLQDLMEEVDKRRKEGKAVDISKLKINGISLVEEAQKGKHALQFNYSILSLERMNKIYDQGFSVISDTLVNAGVNKNEVDELISQMSGITKQIAQTEGVEGISAREPLQYYGSVTQRKVFFNSIAQGNEAIGDFVGAQMRKEDFDSDAVVNSLHKEQAELSVTKDGKTKKVAIEVDSAMLSALNSEQMRKAGVSVRLLDEGAQERFRNYQVSQFFNAAGEAQRYRTVADFSGGYSSKAVDSMNFEDLFEQVSKFKPEISKDVLRDKYMNLGERKAVQEGILRDVYRSLIKNASQDQETYGEDFIMASGETQRVRLIEQWEKNAMATGQLGSGNVDLVQEAIRFSYHDEQLASDLMSAAGRVPTGKMNRYTQTVYDIVHEVLNTEGAAEFFKKDVGVLTGQLNLVNLAMQEGFLTPKNEKRAGALTESDEAMRSQLMSKLEKAYNDVFSLGDMSSAADRTAAKQQLSEAMLNVVLPRATKEIHRDPSLPTLQELLQDEQLVKKYGVNYQALVKDLFGSVSEGSTESVLEQTARKSVNDVVDFLVDNVGWRGNTRSVFNFSTANAGNSKNNVPLKLPRQSSQAPIQLNALIGDVMEDLGVHRGVLLSEPIGFGRKSVGQELNEFAREQMKKSSPPDTSSVPQGNAQNVRSLEEQVRKLKGRNIMSAAIGIAGGLLISGFANNPSKMPPRNQAPAFGNTPIPGQSLPDPATSMAANGSVAASGYPVSLSDSNLNVQRGSSPKAYVINISGTSPRGERAALDAIQASVAGPIPQNSSINIAMNNNYTDTLTQAQVGRIIQTAMGF